MTDVIVIGAGAAGLMAARTLAKAGKNVIILEARDRIGGRIWPLEDKEFGYQAQAGAEFVHGSALVTKALLKEAGLTYVASDGELWNSRAGELTQEEGFLPDQEILHKHIRGLKEDMPIEDYLNMHFRGEKYATLRNGIIKMVEGYDAAHPNKISTFSLREEWLGDAVWEQGRIREGYGALLKFFDLENDKSGVKTYLNSQVKSVENTGDGIRVLCANGKSYESTKVVVTLSIPTICSITFTPALSKKIEAAAKIGFGHVIKILMKFKDRWWVDASGKDLSKMSFLVTNEIATTWWTQYPETDPVLTGWIAGPQAEKLKSATSEEIIEIAFTSLVNIFKIDKDVLKGGLVKSKVVNWPADPYTCGAYSYTAVDSKEAYEELATPVDDKIYFAGEALYNGKETATVEGALASGLEVANKILSK